MWPRRPNSMYFFEWISSSRWIKDNLPGNCTRNDAWTRIFLWILDFQICRRQMVTYRKKYLTLSMFTSYPSRSCSVVSWQCKLNPNHVFAQSFICFDANRSIAEMHWGTKLSAIPCESIVNAMLAMHSISTFVLFVIHGPGPYSTNRWSKSCPNTSWVKSTISIFQFDSYNSLFGPSGLL